MDTNCFASPLSHSSTSSIEPISPCEPSMSMSPPTSPSPPSPPSPTSFPTHSPPFTLPSLDLESLCRAIQQGTIRRIVVLTGAGISVSSGLPDFRSLHTGLYPKLKQLYKLEKPEEIFDLAHIRTNPAPFYAVLRSLWPGQYPPAVMHHFIALLAKKQLLVRNYTQNIDGLERLAGIPSDLVIPAHGTFDAAHCIDCQCTYDIDYVKSEMDQHRIPVCTKCSSLVKPSITLFGESLPSRYKHHYLDDLESTDCLIVAGTSLKVQPFADMIHRVPKHAIRVLINNQAVAVRKPFPPEKTAELLAMKHSSDPQQRIKYSIIQSMRKGFAFGQADNDRDIFLQSNCDDGVRYLGDVLGGTSELDAAIARTSTSIPHPSPELHLDYHFTNVQNIIDHHHIKHPTDVLAEMITSVQIEEIADADEDVERQTQATAQQLDAWELRETTPPTEDVEIKSPPFQFIPSNLSSTMTSSTFTFTSTSPSTFTSSSTSTSTFTSSTTSTPSSTSSTLTSTSAFSFASTSTSSSFTFTSESNFASSISFPPTSSISMPFLSASTSSTTSTSTSSLPTSHSSPSLSIQVVTDEPIPIPVEPTPYTVTSPHSSSPLPSHPPSPVFSSSFPVSPSSSSSSSSSPYIGRKRRLSHTSSPQRRSVPRWEGFTNVPHPMEAMSH